MTEKSPLLPPAISSSHDSPKTINYLAYGSNLTSRTLTGSRHIHPLEVTPVRVPSLTLTFTLAGLPYLEPCFANVRPRFPPPPPPAEQDKELVGVVYKLREEDYSRLFASEGAGTGYQEFTVTCYPLTPVTTDTTTTTTDSNEIIATTLLCQEDAGAGTSNLTRPGCQPSHRYLQLLREGARERSLPTSYVRYLDGLRGYKVTSRRQFVGGLVIMVVWGPALFLMLLFNRAFAQDDGRAPGWALVFARGIMRTVWGCYDRVLVKVFGDGECTEGEEPNWVTGRGEWMIKQQLLDD
ncbi:hypothetical protein B9Z19DRAFT_1100752 [Tuber borchii]|uniref:gamma-glutamylcyclotransferase n=1 Tax=Tuber borchii TaxID=42251 RepID=A0A2T6ZVQ5_TUBBO|nr:hypothetical protein B9Z19DRAFT_1100752 [Tuber borchii]